MGGEAFETGDDGLRFDFRSDGLGYRVVVRGVVMGCPVGCPVSTGLFGAYFIDCSAVCDGHEPRCWGAERLVVAVGFLPHDQVDVLGGFFRHFGVDDDPAGKAINLAGCLVVESGERVVVAAADPGEDIRPTCCARL